MSASNSGVNSLETLSAVLKDPNRYKVLNDLNQFKFTYQTIVASMARIIGMTSTPVATSDRRINSMMLQPTDLSTQIVSAVQEGTNLRLYLADPIGMEYRLNLVVANVNGRKQGIVIERNEGNILLKPMNVEALGGDDPITPADFPAQTYVSEGVQLVQDRGSSTQEGRYIEPNVIYDNLQTYRTDREFARVDNSISYVNQALGMGDMAGAESGMVKLNKNFLAYDLMCQMEYSKIFSQMGTQTVNGKVALTQMGYLEACRLRGGIHEDTSSYITFQKHIDNIQATWENYNGASQEVVTLAGSGYIKRVMNDASLYKITAGTNSVVDGLGLSVTKIVTNFGTNTLVPFPLFNNPYSFKSRTDAGTRNLAESAISFSATPMKDYQNNTVPVIQKHYGAYGGNSAGLHMFEIPGLVDANGKFTGKSANPVDASQVGQIAHESDIIPNAQPCSYYMVA